MDLIIYLLETARDGLVKTVTVIFRPQERMFALYILSSVFAAFVMYRVVKAKGDHATPHDREAAAGNFVQFLFPKHVWSHPSAWLDLRYYLFHRTISHVLFLGLAAYAVSLGFRMGTGGMTVIDLFGEVGLEVRPASFLITFVFMACSLVIGDFLGWFLHYLQHKVPVLWQFHKVHHSSEVMHPISNYREHPIDNLTYIFFINFGFGIFYGAAVKFLGFEPSTPTLVGVPLLSFVFNITAYNLRHSHVWLRWPGVWSAVFPSPAHHHVHHSKHPDHIDKNFAFFLPVWDVIFGTYHMPEDNRDVEFGVPEEQGRDLDTVWRLYWVPFRDAYRELRGKPKADSEKITQTPAE